MFIRHAAPRISLLLVAVAVLFVLAGQADAKIKRIVIDSGHGGHDYGAKKSYVFEKHLAFDVARRLERYLKKRGIRTVMTRRRDKFITLSQRSRMANRYGRGTAFVSIHFNFAYNSGASGVETFYHGGDYAFANYIQRSILSKTRTNSRGTKRGSFYVLRHTKIPAALVECGFLTNWSDRRKCLDPKYRQKVAEGIGAGILRYRRSH